MSERNTKVDLAAVRLEAYVKMNPIADRLRNAGATAARMRENGMLLDRAPLTLSVAEAADFAEVKRRSWQRWEAAGELPKAALERFWRRVDEHIAKEKTR